MKRKDKYSVVLSTVPDKKTGRKIAAGLIGARLAACVSILPGAESRYRWRGKIEVSPECLLVIKTKKSLTRRLAEKIKELHPYEVPEIIFLEASGGSAGYLAWIGAETA